MNPFRKAAAEARNPDSRNYSPALANRIETEGKIANALVKQALADGYFVSVFDGEEMALKFSRDRAAILGAMFSTDQDVLVISAAADDSAAPEFFRFGLVEFIYGNDGYDVMADYSAPNLTAFAEWIKPVEDYAETLAD